MPKPKEHFTELFVQTLKKNIEEIGIDAVLNRGENRNPFSSNKTMHYRFDYAQQVHILNNLLQPGRIYFKTPRKCGIPSNV